MFFKNSVKMNHAILNIPSKPSVQQDISVQLGLQLFYMVMAWAHKHMNTCNLSLWLVASKGMQFTH